jgi:hypothetical protein
MESQYFSLPQKGFVKLPQVRDGDIGAPNVTGKAWRKRKCIGSEEGQRIRYWDHAPSPRSLTQ